MSYKNDYEVLADVRADLEEIDELITFSLKIERPAAKQLSRILRKLLIDGTLQQASNALGVKLRLPATDELPPAAELVATNALFCHATEVYFQGLYRKRIAIHKNSSSPEMMWGQGGELVSIERFCKQIVMSWGAYRVSRHDIIKYVANKLGGVHFDKQRKNESHKVLEALRHNAYAKVSGSGIDYVFRVKGADESLQDKWHRDMVLENDHLDPAMMELYATAFSLLNAEAIRELRQRLTEI